MGRREIMGEETTINKETIKEVLNGMVGVIEKGQIDLYKALTEKSLRLALIYPYENFLSGLIASKILNNQDVRFILMHSRFVEMQFRGLIERVEGSTCCADKTRTIMNRLLNFYKTGEQISFNYEQKYTFRLPEKIFKTHDSIIGFYEGVKGLYYGNPGEYFLELLKIKGSHETNETHRKEGAIDENENSAQAAQ